MSKSNYKLVIKYKDRSWNKTLRGDDWEKHYSDITKFVKKRTNKEIDTECYASIKNTTISSKDVFESLVANGDQSVATEFIVHVCPSVYIAIVCVLSILILIVHVPNNVLHMISGWTTRST